MLIKRIGLTSLIAMTSISYFSYAAPINLSVVSDFNAYVLENMTGYMSDVEGKLGVGGDLTLEHFAIGLLLETDAPYSALVGGNVHIRNAGIYNGKLGAKGQINLNETVGFRVNGNDIGNNPERQTSTDFDFFRTNQILQQKAQSWGQLTATTEVGEHYGNLLFSSDKKFNVFDITVEALSKADKSITYDLPLDSVNIVNVRGSSAHLFNTGFHIAAEGGAKHSDNPTDISLRHDGRFVENIIYNFVDATELTLNAIGFKGSILAPFAHTSFFDGHIDGQMIVRSLTSPTGAFTGQINDYKFTGVVSEPNSLLLLILVLGVSVMKLRRRNP